MAHYGVDLNEKIKVSDKAKRCPTCNGTKVVEGVSCQTCNGTGQVAAK